MAALRKLGVRCVVGFSAVGSLKEEVKPRDFIVVDQLVDWTRGVSFTWLDVARRRPSQDWRIEISAGYKGRARANLYLIDTTTNFLRRGLGRACQHGRPI